MKLYEFESKDLAKNYGIPVPEFVIIKDAADMHSLDDEKKLVAKAQTLTVGSRMPAGAIKISDSVHDAKSYVQSLIGTAINGEKIDSIILEDKIDIKNEYYIGITYDTSARTPVVMFSKAGGTDVEKSDDVIKIHVDPIIGLHEWVIREKLKGVGVDRALIVKLTDVIKNAYACFYKEDLRLLEINPLAETTDGKFLAVDVLIELDDDAKFRHKDRNYPERSVKPLTERELAVKKTNETNYRGTIKYIEFDGDIGFLAAGGGGSITCMDALIKSGGRPANYTEYSGNPSAEKVYDLTKQIISKPGLKGLWIVGAVANFTRVDTTMEGMARALIEMKPTFPIVVRRSGPFEKEGLDLLRQAAKEHELNMQIYGKELPMTESARLIVEAAKNFRE